MTTTEFQRYERLMELDARHDMVLEQLDQIELKIQALMEQTRLIINGPPVAIPAPGSGLKDALAHVVGAAG